MVWIFRTMVKQTRKQHQKSIRHRYTLLGNLIGPLRFQLISDGTVNGGYKQTNLCLCLI